MMFWQKLTLWSILLLLVNLLVFVVPSWQAFLTGRDGFPIIMTLYFGQLEQVLDIACMTVALILGIVSAVWLYRFIYY